MSSWMSAGGGAGYVQNRTTNSANYSSPNRSYSANNGGNVSGGPVAAAGSWMNSDGARRYEDYMTSFSGESTPYSSGGGDDYNAQNDSSSNNGAGDGGVIGWYRKRSTGVKILMWTSSVGALGLIIFFTIKHLIKPSEATTEKQKEEDSIAQRSTAFKELVNQFNDRENRHHQQQITPPLQSPHVNIGTNLENQQRSNGHATNHSGINGFTTTRPGAVDKFNYGTSMMLTDSFYPPSASPDVWHQLER